MDQRFFVFAFIIVTGCAPEYTPHLETSMVGGEEVGTVAAGCGMEVSFNFDRQTVTFYNNTDELRYVEVVAEDGSIIVWTVMGDLWDDGVNTETAVFDHGMLVEIDVYDPIQWPLTTEVEEYLCSSQEWLL